MHWIFWIFWIALISVCGVTKGNKCETMNTAFAESNSKFIHCVTKHNHIIDKHDKKGSYCLGCGEIYAMAAAAHFELTHFNASECRPKYVDNNLLNLVDVLMSNTQHIWDMAVCSDCFDGKCDETTFGQCVVSNRTQNFVSLYEKAIVCIENTEKPCNSCTDEYKNLTILYNKIRKQTGDKFCFDLKVMMNETQKLWSLEYHCFDDKNPPAMEFYALSASSFFIAIFFYGAAFLYSRKKPDIPYIPDDLLPIDHSRSANDSTVSSSDNEPNTSANILNPSTKVIESTDETDDDDQPIIFHPNSKHDLIEIS